jgi:hypothetical protein
MQPETGGRFSVRLLEHDEARARFQMDLATPAGSWSTEAEVALADGAIVWGTWTGAGEPPEWLSTYARAALRLAWRQHGEEGWPRRLTRWRDAPAPGRSRDGSAPKG